jgi:hypothetical protein
LRELEPENAKLKRMYADLALENSAATIAFNSRQGAVERVALNFDPRPAG